MIATAVEHPAEPAAEPATRPAVEPAVDSVAAPDLVSVPEPRESDDDLSTGTHSAEGTQHVDPPETQDAPAALAHRLHHTEKPAEQIQAGVRLHRIPWDDLRARR
jgi:hypothetical protein